MYIYIYTAVCKNFEPPETYIIIYPSIVCDHWQRTLTKCALNV